MRDKRTSVNTNSIFVLPVSDTVELLINYNGLKWSNENINEERLRSFSEKCNGFNISFFENANGKILMFSQKGEVKDSINIYFEGIFMESLPCAFFDKDRKTYDNFVLPSSTTEMVVSVSSDEGFMIEWEFDDEASNDEVSLVEEDEVDIRNNTEAEKKLKSSQDSPDNKKDIQAENVKLKNTCDELTLENKELRSRAEELEEKISKLELQIQSLEESVESATDTGDKDREIAELNRLIRQLADVRFNDLYVETTDSEINELTSSISKRRKVLEEKRDSKTNLEQDLLAIENAISDTKEEIANLMVSIDKAEGIQKDRSTELGERQKYIEALIADLGMDMETLEMYSTDETLENILSEATTVKIRLEDKLKALVQERQRDCDERSNRLKGSS